MGSYRKPRDRFFFLIQVAGLLHEHFSTKTQSTSLSSFVYGEASLIGETSGALPLLPPLGGRIKRCDTDRARVIVRSSIDLFLKSRWQTNNLRDNLNLRPTRNARESIVNNSRILLANSTLRDAKTARLVASTYGATVCN